MSVSMNSVFPSSIQFRETCMPQEFPFSMPIMKYIWSNPSTAVVYQKLIKSCKFFFIKNPILVIKNLLYRPETGWNYCNKDRCWDINCMYHKKININKVKAKIWISKKFCFYTRQPSIFAFNTKIFRYDIEKLTFYYQILSYEDLKVLLPGVKIWHLNHCTVKYGNGKDMLLENIIKLFSGCKHFYMDFKNDSNNLRCNSYAALIEACQNIKRIELYWIHDVFNVSMFYEHFKRSKNRSLIDILVSLGLQLHNKIIDEILETNSFEFVPPVIKYPGCNSSKIIKMEEIQKVEAAKYR